VCTDRIALHREQRLASSVSSGKISWPLPTLIIALNKTARLTDTKTAKKQHAGNLKALYQLHICPFGSTGFPHHREGKRPLS
jgi:hypothetical protein